MGGIRPRNGCCPSPHSRGCQRTAGSPVPPWETSSGRGILHRRTGPQLRNDGRSRRAETWQPPPDVHDFGKQNSLDCGQLRVHDQTGRREPLCDVRVRKPLPGGSDGPALRPSHH